MKYNLGVFSFLITYKFVKCELDPFITGGSFALYDQYPHSILLIVNCYDSYVCGGSVLNQKLVLTAAHCVEDCSVKDDVLVLYGHNNISRMKNTPMDRFVLHEEYDERSLHNDIAIILTKGLIPLNKIIKRVVLMKSPPDVKTAYVSGWGTDENLNLPPALKHTSAYIQKYEVCELMGHIPPGVFCAGPMTGLGAANMGDSGSALIIKEYIQIGIVSYKTMELALVAYTNVSYFLDWIYENTWELTCPKKNK